MSTRESRPNATTAGEVDPAKALPRAAQLVGRRVRLEPLTQVDLEIGGEDGSSVSALVADMFRQACVEDDGYRLLPYGPYATAAEYATALLPWTTSAERQLYVVRELSTGALAGHVGFHSLRAADRSVEVGFIWVAPAFRQQGVAVEAAGILVEYAMGPSCGMVRCEWGHHAANAASGSTGRSIGFTYEGEWRKFITIRGAKASVARYSIVDDEWPDVAKRLAAKIEALPPLRARSVS
ncbi:hypothetical protein HK405_009673 [Cladochytrium tenue]|nr:hypothetical protein HK405_009673 [Cladochytrium tenue]